MKNTKKMYRPTYRSRIIPNYTLLGVSACTPFSKMNIAHARTSSIDMSSANTLLPSSYGTTSSFRFLYTATTTTTTERLLPIRAVYAWILWTRTQKPLCGVRHAAKTFMHIAYKSGWYHRTLRHAYDTSGCNVYYVVSAFFR
jgi:hypothetical protein